MQFEFRGKTIREAVIRSVTGFSRKTADSIECERLSRIRANHANNIGDILEDIGSTIEEINDHVDALGNDARDALIATIGDVASIAFAGAGAIRAIRLGVSTVDAIITGGGAVASLFSVQNILSDYENRLSAFRKWREINSLRSSISSQLMDLNRSIRILSDADDEWTRIGCRRRDFDDPREL